MDSDGVGIQDKESKYPAGIEFSFKSFTLTPNTSRVVGRHYTRNTQYKNVTG